MKAAERLAETSCMALTLAESFWFFILSVVLYSRWGSDQFHFSGGLRFETEFRANPLPSCYLSTPLAHRLLGLRRPQGTQTETSGMASGPGCATNLQQSSPPPLWASFCHL